jgi:hypothetical protein
MELKQIWKLLKKDNPHLTFGGSDLKVIVGVALTPLVMKCCGRRKIQTFLAVPNLA